MEQSHVEKIIGTQVVLMSQAGKMKSLWLPEPPEGKFRFENTLEDEKDHNFYFEARDRKWFACSSEYNFFRNQEGEICNSVEVYDKCIFSLNQIDQMNVVYAESIIETSGVFHNYFVDDSAEISIGRSNRNGIVYPNSLVSHTHAVLRRKNHKWSIEDVNSTNGVFVNGSKVIRTELSLGDNIYIVGLRIIIGVGFISINDGNNRIFVMSQNLHRSVPVKQNELQGEISQEQEREELFNRLPRKRKALNIKPIVIDAPPMSLNSNNIPLLLRMGSPIMTSSISLLAGNITSMLSSVLFPVMTQKYTDRQRKEYEEKRIIKYNEYLEKKYSEIQKERENEIAILDYNYPEIDRTISFAVTKERLWERRTVDDDFLSLRIGRGKYPLLAPYEVPRHGFEMDEDLLMEKMYRLADTSVMLENVPVVISLIEDKVCGIIGKRKLVLELVQRLVMQLSILHSYDEVKTIFLIEQEEMYQLEFIKYMPHIWNDQRNFRFLATDASSGYQISEYLKQEVGSELEKQQDLKILLKERPYYVVFGLSKRIFDSMEVLKDIMQTEWNCGVSVVTAFDDMPKECTKIIELDSSSEHSVISLRQIEKENERFRFDYLDLGRALKSMKEISNVSLKMVTQAYSLPKTVTFLEMFGAGQVEHLNPLKRWADNNPVQSLAAPVGVATDGSLFMLDLHEKFQGPHGLVAGMTGSGKSEFLITYILSMAINYHPDEVAFVLIDYKGGGLADAFDNPEKGIRLPHLMGSITNLDGASIERSLRSLQSEVMRRQQIFKKVKSIADEGTMDIYKYQKLYRRGQIKKPMPHLFIISDEFAELKQQKPEFIDNLISIARIGRSLGVHLILATQKPSGVVNDQIRSNTKFRVCLKVQEKADSQDMLKRSEAAELKETGRFFLQVGYNEFFALGQSAWSGADYVPMDEVIVQKDDTVECIDSVGQNIYVAKVKKEKGIVDKSQLKTVVELLSNIAAQVNIQPKVLWKPELPPILLYESLVQLLNWKAESHTEVLVGLIDIPDKQRQIPLVYDAQKASNLLIIGEQGSGKTSIIQNILLSLVKNCTSDEVNLYILDYSSRILKLFDKLPHCGAVLFEEDTNSLDNFFGVINSIIEERKKLFTSLDVDNYAVANAITSIPLILVVIDGFTGLKSSKIGEAHIYNLKEYIKNGYSYGIKYIISGNHTNDIPNKIRQELGCVWALKLKDKFEYSDAMKHSVNYIPAAYSGRGLVYMEDDCLEFQAVVACEGIGTQDYVKKLKDELANFRKEKQGFVIAKRLPIISYTSTFEEFSSQFGRNRIPIGYALRTKKTVALPLKQFSVMSVYFGNPKGIIPIFENFLFAANREMMDIRIVCRSENSCFDDTKEKYVEKEYLKQEQLIKCEKNSLTALWKLLFAEVTARNAILLEYCAEHHLDERRQDIVKYTYDYMAKNTTPLFVLIENLIDFSLQLDPVSVLIFDKLFQICHKCNIFFVAGIEPDDNKRNGDPLIYGSFISKGCILFSGGQLDKQDMYLFDANEMKGGQIIAHNLCWMKYRDNIYPVLMPCGELEEHIEDEDDASIF